MTDDIVTRLRELAGYVRTDGNTWGEADCLEAADEIERLRILHDERAKVARAYAQHFMEQTYEIERLRAIIAEYERPGRIQPVRSVPWRRWT